VINGQLLGESAYFTSDLFTPHPSRPNYWKIYGRSDDQLIHNTGEKVRSTNASFIQLEIITMER